MKKLIIIIFTVLISLIISDLKSQESYRLSVTTLDNPAPGYLRFDWPIKTGFSVLDNYGYFVNEKTTKGGSDYFWQLKNGNIAQWADNKFYIYNQNMDLIDSIKNPTTYTLDFHDFISLSNGHYLMLCDKNVEMDLSDIVQGGKSDALVIDNILIETDRTGTIYWQWSSLDHFHVTDATSDVDLTQKNIDYAHINSMDEDANGNILISTRHLDEISLINKSTGNMIWRIGGTKCKNNQFTFVNDASMGFTGFSHQHTARFQDNGNILLFDNGNLKNPQYSRAVEYSINQTNNEVTKVWEYRATPDIYNGSMGSTQRLPNGNTLIAWSKEKITEVRMNKSIALEITLDQGYPFYRAQKVTIGLSYDSRTITNPGDYNFSGTGVNIAVTSGNNNGLTHLQKHNYPPHYGEFADSTFSSILPYRWVFTPDGSTDNIAGLFKLNPAGLSGVNNPAKISVYKRNTEASGYFSEIPSSYNSSTGEIVAQFTGFGEFVIGYSQLTKPQLLSPPNNAFITNEGTVSWKKVMGAVSYQIQFDINSSFSQPVISKTVIGLVKYDFSALNFNTKYFWRVRALNSKDTSAWSDILTFNTNVNAPVLVYPSNNFIGLKLNDTLRWNLVDGADRYQVQIALSPDFANPVKNTTNIQQSTFILNSLLNDVKYYWRVRAFKGNDSSKWSENFNFRTVIATPYPLIPAFNSINIPEAFEFQWSSVTGAESYTIQISEDVNFQNLKINLSKITEQKLTIGGLELDKKYYWRIKAIRSTDSSDWSEIWNFHTLLAPPILTEPHNNVINVPVDVKLTWTSEISNCKFKLQVSREFDFSELFLDINDVSDLFYKFTELMPNAKYYWKVKAYKNEIESAWSETFLFVTDKGFQMTGPKLISPLMNSETIADGSLHWSKKNSAATYRVQISKYSDFRSFEFNVSALPGTDFKYSGLEENKKYFWRVKAYSIYDSSAWSDIWNFTVVNPNKVVTLISPGNDALQIPVNGTFEWSSISEIDYYILQIAPTQDFTESVNEIPVYFNNAHQYTDLEMNFTYYWRVRFVRNSELSDWSSVWSFTTKTPKVLDVPKLTNPADNMIAVPVSGEISWESVKDAADYQLSLSNQSNFSTIYFKHSNIKETKLQYSELDYGTVYYLRVAAYNNDAKSNWSQPVSFLTELEPPTITYPENNSVKVKKDGNIIWSLNQDLYQYHIQISTDAGFNNIITEKESIDELTFGFELLEDTEYFCRVKTYNDSNYSRWSDVVKFKTDKATSIGEILENNSGISIKNYPNPVNLSTTFEFSTDTGGFAELTIYDIAGKSGINVFSFYVESGSNNYVWMNDNLPDGVYFYRLTIGMKSDSGKLIINR